MLGHGRANQALEDQGLKFTQERLDNARKPPDPGDGKRRAKALAYCHNWKPLHDGFGLPQIRSGFRGLHPRQ